MQFFYGQFAWNYQQKREKKLRIWITIEWEDNGQFWYMQEHAQKIIFKIKMKMGDNRFSFHNFLCVEWTNEWQEKNDWKLARFSFILLLKKKSNASNSVQLVWIAHDKCHKCIQII